MLGFNAVGRFALGQISASAGPVFLSFFSPLSEPVRKRKSLHASEHQFFAMQPNPVVPFSWFDGLSEPQRQRPALRRALQQYFAEDTTPIPTGRVFWFSPLSEPVRQRRALRTADQQAWSGPSQLRPTPTIFAAMAATETGDSFLGAASVFNAAASGEVGVLPILNPSAEIGAMTTSPPSGEVGIPITVDAPVSGAATSIAYGKVSIRII